MVITLSKDKNIYLLHKVPLIEISVSIRNLGVMLKSGLALEDALETLVEQTTEQKLKESFVAILEDIKDGKSLAEGMKKHEDVFDKIVISIVSVGEQGANLENNLFFLAEYLKKKYKLQKKIKGAMFYPMIIFAISIVEFIGIIFFFLPRLESLYDNLEDPPAFTVAVLDTAEYIRVNVAMLSVVIFVILLIIFFFLRSKPGQNFKEWLNLHIPVFKDLNKKNILLTFSRTLSLLLKSGIAFQEALQITKDTIGNNYYAKALAKVYEDTRSGKNVAQALAEYPQYFPITYTRMIEVGEQTGALEENLSYLYDYYSDDVEELTNNLTTLLEPFMLVFVALLIVFLAISIIAPLYQITGSIGG